VIIGIWKDIGTRYSSNILSSFRSIMIHQFHQHVRSQSFFDQFLNGIAEINFILKRYSCNQTITKTISIYPKFVTNSHKYFWLKMSFFQLCDFVIEYVSVPLHSNFLYLFLASDNSKVSSLILSSYIVNFN